MPVKVFTTVFFLVFLFGGCSETLTPDQKLYLDSVVKFRTEKNNFMKNDPASPFRQDSNAVFADLKYYDIDTNFVFRSRLYRYEKKDTITIFGTKGEERKVIRFGYILLNHGGKDFKVNIYNGRSRSGEAYYSIWFTDQTTGNETYGVGRYIDFDLHPDTSHIYTIDFNLSYNPYCAYSSRYSCAIPTKEDYIDLAIEAGEKKFHE